MNREFCDLAGETFGHRWKTLLYLYNVVESTARVKKIVNWVDEPTVAECDRLFKAAAEKRDNILESVDKLQIALPQIARGVQTTKENLTPLFLEHNGVKVYRCYRHKHGDPWSYWFATNLIDADTDYSEELFDARQLTGKWLIGIPSMKQWKEYLGGRGDHQMLIELITKAIDDGRLK